MKGVTSRELSKALMMKLKKAWVEAIPVTDFFGRGANKPEVRKSEQLKREGLIAVEFNKGPDH